MDPVTLVVSAVAVGAAAGVTDTAAQAVKDAYAGLKRLLGRRGVDVAAVERRPDSTVQRAALHETLSELGADAELLTAAQGLVDAVRENAPSVGPALGIDLDQVEAEFLRVQRVRSEGTGVSVRRSRFRGGIEIGDVDAGSGPPDRP